ncbi:linker histone H1M [Festucalex cinctus]
MPPKKPTVALNEMPAASKALLASKVKRKSGVVTLRRISMHPTTSVMVVEALKVLDSRKGVTKQAIQNFIKRKYPSVDNIRLKYFVGRALNKGLENGTLVRPANSPVTTSILGRFRLAPKRKESKAKAENVEPNVETAAKEAPETKAGGIKRAAADELKSPKKKVRRGPSKSKKDEEDVAPPSKVAPAKKPKAKKAANEKVDAKANVKSKAKSKETADAEKTTKAKSKDAADAEKTKAMTKEAANAKKTKAKPIEAADAEKTKEKTKEAANSKKTTKAKSKEADDSETKVKPKGAKGKAAKISDKETEPKDVAAKRGRKKNIE